MDDISKALAAAFQYHQSGRFTEAEQLYRQVLARQPAHADALHLLGVAILQQGRPAEALDLLSRAVRVLPDNASYLTNLGKTYSALQQWDNAAETLRRAVALAPNSADAHLSLGLVERNQGQLESAADSFERAATIDPACVEAHYNLGNALYELGRFEAAERCYRQTIRRRPGYWRALNNLGKTLRDQGRLDDAIEAFRQSIALQPDYPLGRNNLGTSLADLGRIDEALVQYDEAIRLKPDYAEAHYHRALALLSRGDFAAGWAEYEWRWKTKDAAPFAGPQPRWDGSPLAGRTILLQAEQGLGDTLQFVRYTQLVQERDGRVLLQCQPPLVRLLERCPGVERVVPLGTLAEFDVYAPLMSLPGILGTTRDTVPNQMPYLTADPHLIEQWRQRLATFDGFKVGITWQGNPKYPYDRVRSAPLAAFWPLTKVPGVRLFSLQKGWGTEQIAAAAERVPLIDLDPELDLDTGAFMDTAAVIMNLDLVVTSDNALPHVAGGLGAPVWVALPHVPDWRWLVERDTSPWYPSMRLYRQEKAGDWEGVFQRIAAALPRPH